MLNYVYTAPRGNCAKHFYHYVSDAQKTLSDFNESAKKELEELATLSNYTGWKRKQARIWMILDHPRSSTLALVLLLYYVSWDTRN